MRERHNWSWKDDPAGTKWCPGCRVHVAFDGFSKSKHGFRGLGAYCKPCVAQKNREIVARRKDQPDLTAEARFWPKVNKDAPGGCWLWTGSIGSDRYGRFMFRGTVRHAHRVAMILSGFDVPADRDVDHCVCRDRRCVNPAHLRVATERENALENNDSPFAKNGRKTHCKHGHELAGDNILIVPIRNFRGKPCTTRACIACHLRRRPGATRINGVPIPGRAG